MARTIRIAAAGGIVALALTTAGCISLPVPPVATPTVDPSPTETAAGGEEWDDVFAERDAFIEAQGLPLDGSPLVAVTPEQKEFIRQQREYVESQGATWTAQDESTALALTADACETSILNKHQLDESLLQTHVATSPLISALLGESTGEQRAMGERNVVSVAVFGTQFMCADDAPQWQAAFEAVYGG